MMERGHHQYYQMGMSGDGGKQEYSLLKSVNLKDYASCPEPEYVN